MTAGYKQTLLNGEWVQERFLTEVPLELVIGENGLETDSFSNFLSVYSYAVAWVF